MVQLPADRHRPAAAGASAPRSRGRVLWFDQIQGVGLARIPGRGQVHLYHKNIQSGGYRALDAGDRITFWIEETDGGPVLRDIRVERSLPRE